MGKRAQKWRKLLLLLICIGSAAMYGCHSIQTRRSREAYEKAAELAAQEKAVQEKAAQEKAVQEKAAQEKAAQEKAAQEKAAQERAAREAMQEEITEAPQEGREELVEVRYWKEIVIEDDPYMETLEEINLEALREVNEDVLGWIVIPGTQLEYPLMRGDDNEYYLERSWEGKPNVAGSIFMEQVNDRDFKHFNTVLYGHRMKDGSMFGSLKHYASESYWEKHPYVYIVDDGGIHRYEIFAAYEATLEGSTYQVGFSDDESKQQFLENCVGYSDIDTGVVPGIEDRIITLSTCTGKGYDSRWVVQARRKGELVAKLEPKENGRQPEQ